MGPGICDLSKSMFSACPITPPPSKQAEPERHRGQGQTIKQANYTTSAGQTTGLKPRMASGRDRLFDTCGNLVGGFAKNRFNALRAYSALFVSYPFVPFFGYDMQYDWNNEQIQGKHGFEK